MDFIDRFVMQIRAKAPDEHDVVASTKDKTYRRLGRQAIGMLIVLYPDLKGHLREVVGRMLMSVTTMDMVKLKMNLHAVPYAKRLRKPV